MAIIWLKLKQGFTWIVAHGEWCLATGLVIVSALFLYSRYRKQLTSLADALDVEKLRQNVRDLEVERRVLEARVGARKEEIDRVDGAIRANQQLVLETLNPDKIRLLTNEELEDEYAKLGF